jgi:hypothetical protein
MAFGGSAASYPHFAAPATIAALVAAVGPALAVDLGAHAEIAFSLRLAWAAIAGATVAQLACLRLAPGYVGRVGLFASGLVAIALAVHQQSWDARHVVWAIGGSLAGYALIVSAIDLFVWRSRTARRILWPVADDSR